MRRGIRGISTRSTRRPPNPRRFAPKGRGRGTRVQSVHGRELVDEFAWLEDPNDPGVRQYLKAENEYLDSVIESKSSVRRELLDELIQIAEATSASGPASDDAASAGSLVGGYRYYSEFPSDGEGDFPRYMRRREGAMGGMKGPAECVIDQNELAESYPYTCIEEAKASADGRYVAFTMDVRGDEVSSLFLVDMTGVKAGTGPPQPKQWSAEAGSFEWFDKKSVLYTVPDDSGRPASVQILHVDQVGRVDAANEKEIEAKKALYYEKDARFYVDVQSTKDHSFILITSTSKTSSEVWLVETGSGNDMRPRLVLPRREGHVYFVESANDYLYTVTNGEGAENFEVRRIHKQSVCAADRDPVEGRGDAISTRDWELVVQHDPSVSIEEMDIFGNHLVLFQRANGCPGVRVVQHEPLLDPEAQGAARFASWVAGLPGDGVGCLSPLLNLNYNADEFTFEFSSPLSPNVECSVQLNRRTAEDEKQVAGVAAGAVVSIVSRGSGNSGEEVQLRDELAAKYVIEEESVSSSVDGEAIPVTVVRPRGAVRSGPVLLFGYGAYGQNLDVEWNPEFIPLLRRGWTLAYAHVRGGLERGRWWHRAGTLASKPTSIADFNDVAADLVESGLARRGDIAVHTSSAGGLLAAAAANTRPDLYSCLILRVPFLDPLTAMLDPDMPLTQHDYDEWGDPLSDPEAHAVISGYSPYQNIAKGVKGEHKGEAGPGPTFPHVLLSCGLKDSRVAYWQVAKYLARLRTMVDAGANEGSSGIYAMRASFGSGHYGEGGRLGRMEEAADEITFLLAATGGIADSS